MGAATITGDDSAGGRWDSSEGTESCLCGHEKICRGGYRPRLALSEALVLMICSTGTAMR
jgi:hypothetical protein